MVDAFGVECINLKEDSFVMIHSTRFIFIAQLVIHLLFVLFLEASSLFFSILKVKRYAYPLLSLLKNSLFTKYIDA